MESNKILSWKSGAGLDWNRECAFALGRLVATCAAPAAHQILMFPHKEPGTRPHPTHTGSRALLHGRLKPWLRATFSPLAAVILCSPSCWTSTQCSCQTELPTLAVGCGQELYRGCAPFLVLLSINDSRKKSVGCSRWTVTTRLWTATGKLKFQVEEEENSISRTQSVDGKVWGAAWLHTGAATNGLDLDLTWIRLPELHPVIKRTRLSVSFLGAYLTSPQGSGNLGRNCVRV